MGRQLRPRTSGKPKVHGMPKKPYYQIPLEKIPVLGASGPSFLGLKAQSPVN